MKLKIFVLICALLFPTISHADQKWSEYNAKTSIVSSDTTSFIRNIGTTSSPSLVNYKITYGNLFSNTQITALNEFGSNTKTAGNILVADGTQFQSVGMSGACSLSASGAISCSSSSSLFTDSGTGTYLEQPTDAFILGSNVLSTAVIGVEPALGRITIGRGTGSNGNILMRANNGASGQLVYAPNDTFSFLGGNIGIGTTAGAGGLQLSAGKSVVFPAGEAGTWTFSGCPMVIRYANGDNVCLYNDAPGDENIPNVFFGHATGGQLGTITGLGNSAFGAYVTSGITNGVNNTAMGISAGNGLTTGNENVFLGHSAGSNIVNGDNNVMLGANAGFTSTSDTNNAVCIGANCKVAQSNMIVLGNSANTLMKVGIGNSAPTARLNITPSTQHAVRIEPFGSSTGNTGEVQYKELTANGVEYVGFKAADSIATNVVWVLPSSDGVGCIGSDGSGNLSITTCSGSGGGGGASQLTGLTDVGSSTAGAGRLLINDGTKFQSKLMSGQCTINSAGAIDCGQKITGAQQLTGLSDVGTATITAGRLLVADGTKFQSTGMGGDGTLSGSGSLDIQANTIGPVELSAYGSGFQFKTNASITVDVDGRIVQAAQGSLTGLSDVGSATIAAGNMLIADGTKFQSAAITGSCSITSAGVMSCSGGGSGSGATQLTGLSDVGSSTVGAGRLLINDGTKFQSILMNGQCSIGASGYINCLAGSTGGATQLTGLTDVGSATITAGRLLVADGTKFQAVAVTMPGGFTMGANAVLTARNPMDAALFATATTWVDRAITGPGTVSSFKAWTNAGTATCAPRQCGTPHASCASVTSSVTGLAITTTPADASILAAGSILTAGNYLELNCSSWSTNKVEAHIGVWE